MDQELNQEVKDEQIDEVEDAEVVNDNVVKKSNGPVVFIILALLVLGGVFIFKNMGSKRDSKSTTNPNSGPVKEFTVDGSNFKFEPSTLNVNKGDNVKITFKDDDGFHNLVVDGYNVQTKTINTGAESSVTFIADKTGTFDYYCSVGSHREKGMVGKFIVQ